MLRFIARRVIWAIPMLALISIVSFALIQLPPGDFMTAFVAQTGTTDELLDDALVENLRRRYGLDRPVYVQYLSWIGGFPRGDFGYSFEWRKPVSEVIGDRLALTALLSVTTLLFTWGLAIPAGIYSALRQYSVGDYALTLLGFIGLATPNFLLALVLMFFSLRWFGTSVGGLFSPEFIEAPWSIAKAIDLLQHLWIPVIVLGTAGTASVIRIMRGNLLDELQKPYVVAARARGLSPMRVILRYPVRIALNPIISSVAWLFPRIVSGSTITSVVLSLPTAGPLLLRALLNQDMYLAGTFVMLLASMTLLGTLISDILLALIDPRIRSFTGDTGG